MSKSGHEKNQKTQEDFLCDASFYLMPIGEGKT